MLVATGGAVTYFAMEQTVPPAATPGAGARVATSSARSHHSAETRERRRGSNVIAGCREPRGNYAAARLDIACGRPPSSAGNCSAECVSHDGRDVHRRRADYCASLPNWVRPFDVARRCRGLQSGARRSTDTICCVERRARGARTRAAPHREARRARLGQPAGAGKNSRSTYCRTHDGAEPSIASDAARHERRATGETGVRHERHGDDEHSFAARWRRDNARGERRPECRSLGAAVHRCRSVDGLDRGRSERARSLARARWQSRPRSQPLRCPSSDAKGRSATSIRR